MSSQEGGSTESRVALDAVSSAGEHPVLRHLPHVAIITFDRNLRLLSAGGLGLAAMGLTAGSLVGRTLAEALGPEAAARLDAPARAALAGEESTIDVVLRGRTYEQRLAAVRDATGAVVAGIGSAIDVTPTRETAGALRESEERFRVAFDNAPIGEVIVALDGTYLQINRALCQMVGYTREEMLQLKSTDISATDELAEELVLQTRLLAGEIETYMLPKSFVSPSGEKIWMEKSVSLVRGADGDPLYFVAQVQNITERIATERALGEERRRLRESQSLGRLGSWELDVAAGTVSWSETMFELYGLDPAEFTGDPGPAYDCVHPGDRAKVEAAVRACALSGEPLRIRYRVVRPVDGALRWFDARARAVWRDGVISGVVGTIADVTDLTAQVLAEAAASAASAFQQAVISASADIIYVYDVAQRATVWTNRSFTNLLGYEPVARADAGPAGIETIVPAEELAAFEASIDEVCAGGDDAVVQLDLRLVHLDGSSRWFSQRSSPLARDEQGRVTRYVGALRDVTTAMMLQRRMEHGAWHDELTGLPNRALLVDRLDAALARSQRERREVAVLFCDLDSFKRVNDTAGHAAGDEVLREAARRLQEVIRAGDTVARVGGDEFVVVVEPWNRVPRVAGADQDEATDLEHDRSLAFDLAHRLSAALRRPFRVNGVEHVVSASIGVTHSQLRQPGDEWATSDEMLQDADSAMYRAKGAGKDRVEVFEHAMRSDLAERGRVEHVLRAALRGALDGSSGEGAGEGGRRARFSAAFQPVFDSSGGLLVQFEALARLTADDGASIAPDLFIAVAEETGQIGTLGRVMLDLACGQLARWRAEFPGLAGVTMAVNVSALQAQNASLGGEVERILSTHRLVPADLVLELTETALLRATTSTMATVRSLHEAGVGIAIDDFGTGYASLRYLATLPVSELKVDRSFTAGLPTDTTCRKIVTAVAGLAADLDLVCVVEGVETVDQLGALPDGVQVQGWLTGRPQAACAVDLAELATRGALR